MIKTNNPILIGRKMIISLCIGVLITFLIWLCRDLLTGTIPLLIFNLMGILSIPGGIITLVITGIISPQRGWQAIHEVSPYNYFTYAGNFFFYFLISYLIQLLIVRLKKKYD